MNNQSRHVLYTKLLGQQVIQEPKGWSNDIPSFKRDKSSRGILVKTTVDLEFYGDGADWLELVFKSFGVSEKVFLMKYEKDVFSVNERWKLRYNQQLDMGTYERDDETGQVKVVATEGGLYEEIKNRMSDKYDLLNQESADGEPIGVLKTKTFQPQPRSIFFNSLLESSFSGYRINSEDYKSSYSNTVRTVPLKVVYNLNDAVETPVNAFDGYNDLEPHDQDETGANMVLFPTYSMGSGTKIDPGQFFLWRSDIQRTVNISISLKFKISKIGHSNSSDEILFVELRRAKFQNGSDFGTEIISELLRINDPFAQIGVEKTISQSFEINVDTDESLALVFHTFSDLGSAFGAVGHFDVYLDVTESKLIVEDATDYALSISRCIKPFDLFERLVAKITGENDLFKSTIFGPGGKYEHMVVDNGFWARGFPDKVIEEDNQEREIQFNTSFKEAFEAYNYLEPLCWFTEISEGKSVVRIEEATYTMKNFVGVSIGSVDKLQEKGLKKEFFSKITIGSLRNLEYEETNGLDEPNGISEFTTHIKFAENEYKIHSPYRHDSVGYELTRRKQYSVAPKEDTERDSHIFMHDAKYDNGTYYHKLWADRFSAAPTGLYSPSTAWNLWLTPMNRLFYGHGYSINRGLYHYPGKYVRFNSSNANKNVRTTVAGKELHEGGSFMVSDLEKPRIEPMQYEVTFAMNQSIEDDIRGTTTISGEEVPNYFGLIEFTKNGEKFYGRLVNLDAEEESKLTLITAKL